MSEKDTVSKKYLRDNTRFADLFNFFLYKGRQVIKPEQLKPLDTAEITLPYGNDGKSSPVQKQRDIIKVLTAKSDGHFNYVLLATELQSKKHYAMPPKNMLYDAVQYTDQVEIISKAHRSNKDKPSNDGEFLSGFYKTDKLLPVITLTVYFGADEWDAPRSLHEMLMVEDSSLLEFIPDYKLNLITPAEISENEFELFRTELNQVMKFVKYSDSKEHLNDILQNDPIYRDISRESAEMIRVMTNTPITVKESEESVDMCKAWEDMMYDARAEGKAEGRAEGRAEGKAEGRAEGRAEGKAEGRAEGRAEGKAEGRAEGKAEGRAEGILSTLCDLVKKGIITLEQAATQAKMPVSEFMEKSGLPA